MSATILHEPDIQSLCCDTFWATKTDPAVPRSLDDKHKAWWLGPYFEFCTHLFKEKTPLGITPPSAKKKFSPLCANFRSQAPPRKPKGPSSAEPAKIDVSTNAQINKSIALAVRLLLMVNYLFLFRQRFRHDSRGRSGQGFLDGWPTKHIFRFRRQNPVPFDFDKGRPHQPPIRLSLQPGVQPGHSGSRAAKAHGVLDMLFALVNNLAEYLELDERRWRIYIFRHAEFLKHQL